MQGQTPAALRSVLQGLRQLAEPPSATTLDGLEATAACLEGLSTQLLTAVSSGAGSELVAMEAPLVLALVTRRLLEDLEPLLEAAAGSADTPGSPGPADQCGSTGGAAFPGAAETLGAGVAAPAALTIRILPVTPSQRGTGAAAAAQQVISTGLAPALQAAMERVAAAVLDVDDATLTARAAAHPGTWLMLVQGLLCWFAVLVRAWRQEAMLGSPVSGPLALPAVRLLLADALLGGRVVEQHVAGGALRPFADEALVHKAFTYCGWGEDALGNAFWRPYIQQLWRSQAYLRVVVCAMVQQACVLMQTGSSSSQGGQGGGSEEAQAQQQAHARQEAWQQQQQAAVDALQQLVGALGLPAHMVSFLAACHVNGGTGIDEFQNCASELWCITTCLLKPECAPVARQALGVLAPLPGLLLAVAARYGGADVLVVKQAAYTASFVLLVLSMHQGGVDVAGLPPLLAHTVSLLQQAAAASSDEDEEHVACVSQLFDFLVLLVKPDVQLCALNVAELAPWRAVAARLAAAVEGVLRNVHTLDCDAGTLCHMLCAAHSVTVSSFEKPELAGASPLLLAVSQAPVGGAEQQQFFAMLVTARKLFPRVARITWPGNLQGIIAHVFFVASFLHLVGSISTSTSSSSSQSAAPQLPWLALLAQAVQLTGTLLQAGLSGEEAGEAPVAAVSRCAFVCAGAAAGLQFMCRRVLRAGPEQPAATAAAAVAAATAWPDVQPHLQQLQQQLLPLVQQGRGLLSHAAAAMRQQRNSTATAAGSGNDCEADAAVVDAAVEAAPTATAQAAAAGLDPALLAAVDAAVACSDAEVLRALQRSFVATSLPAQLLEAAGALSAALPHRYCCNNPGCTNLAGASEAALVGGKRCVCTGCHSARYCGQACQAAHWRHHKPVCRRLRRAAAAVAPA